MDKEYGQLKLVEPAECSSSHCRCSVPGGRRVILLCCVRIHIVASTDMDKGYGQSGRADPARTPGNDCVMESANRDRCMAVMFTLSPPPVWTVNMDSRIMLRLVSTAPTDWDC